MTFISSLPALWWVAFAAIPISVVLLYLLKLKRQPLAVPSTFLWTKTIEDLHANSLLQRLRTSPLLFLQLLAITLAAFALLRPGFQSKRTLDSKRIFVLDASASMASTDTGSQSRFEQAKLEISRLVEEMSDQDEAMLMTVSDRTDVLQAFTSDRNKLRNALQAAKVSTRSTDLQSAIRAAEGLSTSRGTATESDQTGNDTEPVTSPNQDATRFMLFSDGRFAPPEDWDDSRLRPAYVRLGTETVTNLGIVAFSATHNENNPQEQTVFATVGNFGTVRAKSSVTLKLDGNFVDADEVELEPGAEVGLSFTIAADDVSRLALVIDQADDLMIDNQAYAVTSPLNIRSVLLITSGNEPLEYALETEAIKRNCLVEVVKPDYLKTDAYKARASAGADHLIIYDRVSPETMPMVNTFFIGSVPPAGWKTSKPVSPVLLTDINRAHPIMRYLDLFSLLIAEGTTLQGPAGTLELLTAESGPALAIGPRDGFEDLVLGFELLSVDERGNVVFNTDWQVQRSWPVFVFNAVRYLTGAVDAAARTSFKPGSTVTLDTGFRQSSIAIQRPDGGRDALQTDATGRISYPVNDQLGIYDVVRDDKVVDLFCVNLFDRQESTIASVEQVQLGDTSLNDDQGLIDTRREYWRWILCGMLGILTLEWWVYSRRIR